MAKLKRSTTGKDDKPKVSYRPFITGAKGQSHDDIVSKAPQYGFELGERDVNYHLGMHPNGEQNEIHGGEMSKCTRGCMSATPRSSILSDHTSKYILKTPAIDTRQGVLPLEVDLKYYSLAHIRDVQHLMMHVMKDMLSDVLTYDWTKLAHTDKFLNNFERTMQGEKFKTQEWWSIHKKNERHHPLEYTGDHKVTLTDVIHMLADWVAAGRARSSEIPSLPESIRRSGLKESKIRDLLWKAFVGTFEWLQADIEVLSSSQMSVSEAKAPDESNSPKATINDEIVTGNESPSSEDVEDGSAIDNASEAAITDVNTDIPKFQGDGTNGKGNTQ
jgi:hypothetical protein